MLIDLERAASPAKRAYREEFLNDIVLQRFDCIALDVDIANRCGQLFHHLETAGQRIGHSDTWIAASALALGHAVVTHNLEHFHRVRGLRVAPWQR